MYRHEALDIAKKHYAKIHPNETFRDGVPPWIVDAILEASRQSPGDMLDANTIIEDLKVIGSYLGNFGADHPVRLKVSNLLACLNSRMDFPQPDPESNFRVPKELRLIGYKVVAENGDYALELPNRKAYFESINVRYLTWIPIYDFAGAPCALVKPNCEPIAWRREANISDDTSQEFVYHEKSSKPTHIEMGNPTWQPLYPGPQLNAD